MCPYPHLVLLVLAGVGEAGDNCGDTGRRGDLAGVDHDEQLHQVVVDLPAAALDDVHVLATHALPDFNTGWERQSECGYNGGGGGCRSADPARFILFSDLSRHPFPWFAEHCNLSQLYFRTTSGKYSLSLLHHRG